jgi:hypothetical protein
VRCGFLLAAESVLVFEGWPTDAVLFVVVAAHLIVDHVFPLMMSGICVRT